MFVTAEPHKHVGQTVNTGHCVALVQRSTGAPHTSRWRRGEQVRGSAIPWGTAIATFSEDGRYENDVTGRSHAAIYLDQTPQGLRVIDQWLGRRAGERIIRFKNGAGLPVDDGDAYFVVVTA